MVDIHSQSFFGQNVGLIVRSQSRDEAHIFFTFTRKKQDGSWEKFKKGEGKSIKLSLEEIAMILEVLKSHRESWSTVHSFKQEKTPIKIEWEQNNQEKLWLSVGKYNKMLSMAQIKILTALLTHLFKEKIEFATIPLNLGDSSQSKETVNIKRENMRNTESALKNILVIKEEIVSPSSQTTNSNEEIPIRIVKKDSDSTSLLGIIKAETKKAILIEFGDHKQTWIPKSQIHSEFDANIEKEQEFIIDTWILKKNKIVA